ncbi:PAS domain-containing protein [Aquabacterium fontiphilum]|uniref:PAS-domain containing protein n=1 Tax=Aquabacterium fontiphilum TaxID=450365 RepID=UPI0013776C2C|nr:PAS-domain containing protein [Aquabacterium fontiphilum]NBD19674.1 PAS domain-containing protein [Aquabacterium fontiphilum]
MSDTTIPSRPDNGNWRQFTLQAGVDLLDRGLSVFDADLRMVAWNRAFLELLDFPPELAFVGASFESFIRYNARRGEYGDQPEDEAVRERVALAMQFLPHDIERMRPDGRILRITGQPLPGHGFVTLYSDVTEQRRAEEALLQANAELESRVLARTAELQRSEHQMRLVTDSIPALIAYFRQDRSYTYINRGYQDWFGLDPARPETVSARSFLGSEVYERIRPFVARALTGQPVTFDYELQNRAGRTLAVRTSLIPDRAPDGEVLGCFELTFDITQEKQSQALVVRAQKMKAMGQLTGGLAHDFNNILTIIIGNLSALADARPDDPMVSEFTGPAIAAARRGAELIRGLMTFARQQPLQAGAVDACSLADAVVRLVRPALPANLTLECDVPDEPVWIWIDPTQLENALVNLLLNARDATRGHGRIDVDVSVQTLDVGQADALMLSPGAYARLSVQDDGVGMDAATQARIFEPFFTTKRPGSGTGLGMSMVYGFVRQSGGAVELHSAPGAGTTVSLYLPLADMPEDDLPLAEAPLMAGQTAHRGVALLVEDDADVRRVVRRNLLDLGYAVLEAAHAQEALDILAQMSDIRLLLSDIVMPGEVDGVMLARHARQRHPGMQVLLMSGYAPDVEALTDLPVLSKPFTAAELAAALGGGSA